MTGQHHRQGCQEGAECRPTEPHGKRLGKMMAVCREALGGAVRMGAAMTHLNRGHPIMSWPSFGPASGNRAWAYLNCFGISMLLLPPLLSALLGAAGCSMGASHGGSEAALRRCRRLGAALVLMGRRGAWARCSGEQESEQDRLLGPECDTGSAYS